MGKSNFLSVNQLSVHAAMEVLKHIAINSVPAVLLFVVLIPAAMSEGRYGHGEIVVMALIISMVMTIVSTLAYGIGNSFLFSFLARTLSALLALYILMIIIVAPFSIHPSFLQIASQYWVGIVISLPLIIIQAIYNRKHFGVMLGIRGFDF